ncbi:hypothetical protein LMG27952_01269 [Paraburkholderia hiiakae]|uniref:Uncharacterized protein n=1 Tax=Paraburkholderia hiiakae TaxID=1081782 RepID=A0ABM8NEG2_9BURK|nr:hypothetical protein LMG27952_01269 [Paraburkholderia hiiakae]
MSFGRPLTRYPFANWSLHADPLLLCLRAV